jgi:hypothetical protein
MRRHFKRRWDESRGDEFDGWGGSDWYFEVDDKGYPVRQVEKYDQGQVLKFGAGHDHDRFGGLGDQPLDLEEFSVFAISPDEFEAAWAWGAVNWPSPQAG